ncbi:hypothetical protein Plhal304r1_c008g0031511 [Plasmopara halstedii]
MTIVTLFCFKFCSSRTCEWLVIARMKQLRVSIDFYLSEISSRKRSFQQEEEQSDLYKTSRYFLCFEHPSHAV